MMVSYISKWKCGNCGRIYTTEQYIRLQQTKAVEKDTDPERQHGYVGICELCGYRFHLDKWLLHDFVDIQTEKGKVRIKVSSAFLELNHGFKDGEELYYETMLFPEVEWLECGYQARYETKEEAIKDHERVINLLKEGKYKIEDNELILEDSNDKMDIVFKLVKLLKNGQRQNRKR